MSTMTPDRRQRFCRAALTGATLAMLAGASAGCSTTGTSDVDLPAHDPRLRHPIMISNEPETLEIPVGMRGPALSPTIERAIRGYVAGYAEHGTGAITIQVPAASANEVAAGQTGQAVHYALVRAGVPRGQIQVAPYYVGDHAKVAAMRLTYLRVKAVAPQCGIWPETLPNRFDNAQYHNFGCAAQQNLAAMVANPADFVAPEPMGTANGARRAKVIIDYGQGLETRSETELLDTDLEVSN
ncbi:MAG: CpaD family pilus assembly protein [Rhizobiales bacterium]|nr:CpaD family pilus assembly protein [Hyphomicrobiales bacterium]